VDDDPVVELLDVVDDAEDDGALVEAIGVSSSPRLSMSRRAAAIRSSARRIISSAALTAGSTVRGLVERYSLSEARAGDGASPAIPASSSRSESSESIRSLT
jgi:hypothetical protein